MQYVCSILALITALSSFSLQASWYSPNNKMGFKISPVMPDNANWALKSGDIYTFQGEVCVVQWWHHNQNEKCQKLKERYQNLRFFYPDALTEVTDQVEIEEDNGKKSLKYSFTTPELQGDAPNTLTVLIGSERNEIEKLLKTKAKLQKRIAILQDLRDRKYLKHFHAKFFKEYINRMIAILSASIEGIDRVVDEDPQVLAKLSQPLQVDNQIAGPLHYSSNFSGHRLALTIPLGSPIEGESTQVSATVTNLSHLNFNFPMLDAHTPDNDDEVEDDNAHKYEMALRFNGQELFNLENLSLALGESHTETRNIGPLSPYDPNMFELELTKTFKFKFLFFNYRAKRKWGAITLAMPVSPDEVVPVISETTHETIRYTQHMPPIMAKIVDEFGRLDPSTFKLTTSQKDFSDKLQLTNLDLGRAYSVTADLNPIEEGEWTLNFSAKDFAGNEATHSHIVRIDRTKPVIVLGNSDNTLTNNPSYTLPVIVDDHSPIQVQVFHNGHQVLATDEAVFDLNVTLVEGINTFEVRAIDAASNEALAVKLNNVELDTVPPSIIGLLPAEGAILSQLDFNVSGQVSELLQSFTVNNQAIVLNADKRFNKSITAPMEGVFSFEIVASDLAGNVTTINRSVQIVLKVINENLITIVPNDKTGGLTVIGLPGAARPGIQVKVFPNTSALRIVTSSDDGSFSVNTSVFNNVYISGYDPETDREDSATITYNLDTTLSGVIKDIAGNPLPGVTVSISDTNQSAVTNASGVFLIAAPATGDKTLSIDGATIPVEVSGPNKKYAKTAISVSIGTNQLNVLGDPIYLAPLMFDGTETVVTEEETVTITSPHAPGLVLEVPAGTAIFPDGSKSGVINAIEISSDVASLAPLDFVKPDTVVALEPSGLTFTEPVQLTLPNINEFPAGMQAVVMSKNSVKGIWEIGGIARVSDDGSSVTTEPGQGILHFSEVYMAPLGPTVTTYGNDARPGATTFDGAMSTAIQLPSYKVFDKDVSTGLIYKSAWSTPSVVVSSVFDVPRQEFAFSNSTSFRGLLGKGSSSVEGRAWIQPKYLDTKTTVENIETETTRYTGIPNKSLISYGIDLSSLPSGISPYLAHFEMKLEHMVVGTVTTKTKKLFGGTRTKQESFSETRDIEKIFPSDLSGPLFIQNKINSPMGRGWDIASASRIHKVDGPRLMVEENGGQLSTYGLSNTIDSFYVAPNPFGNASFDGYPSVILSGASGIKKVDANSKEEKEIPNITKNFSGYFETLGFNAHNGCMRKRFTFSIDDSVTHSSFFNDKIINLTEKGLVYYGDMDSNLVAGYIQNANHLIHKSFGYCFEKIPENFDACYEMLYCKSNYPISTCHNAIVVDYQTGNFDHTVYEQDALLYCGAPTEQGFSPKPGYSEGYNSAFNNPKFSLAHGDGILIADYGNHRIRYLNLETKEASTQIGNGQTFDSGDGGLATQASLYRPKGLAKDLQGNLYISTENGYIRRVDPNGFISTFAGKPVSQGGTFSDVAHAEQMAFNQPYGMVVDDENGYLYVADTGNHRVVKIDFETKTATVVAGNGTCFGGNNVGDGKSALDASLCHPTNVGLDENKNLLIADSGHSRLRRVTFNSGNGTSLTYLSSAPDNSTLTRYEDGSFERKFRDGSVMLYNADGLQTLSRSRVGLETQYLYDSQKRLVSMIDPAGKETIYSYSGDKLASITDPAGRQTSFYYDGDFLTEVTFPDNTTRSFVYNERGLLIQEVNQRGIATNYEYNEWNRLSKVIRADSSFVELSDVKSKTVGNAYTGGNVGQLKSLNDETIYDGIKDAKGVETKYNSDETGYVVSIIDGQGRKTSIERDVDGRPVKIVRPDESFAEFVYAPVTGDLISKTDNGLTTSYQFNNFGDLLRQENSLGQWIQNIYDNDTGLLLSSTNHAGQTSSATYTVNGFVSSRTNAIGATTSYAYGQDFNLASITDPIGNVTSYDRDVVGNVVKVTNANGQFTQHSFDLFNRLLSVTDARGNTTGYEYLSTGELSKITDPRGNQTLFAYNSLGQMIEKTNPLGFKTSLAYDVSGNVISELDPNGNLKTFEYNSRDELVKKILPDNIYEMTYDSYGNLESVSDKNSVIEFDYARIAESFKVEEEVWTGRGELSGMGSHVLTHDYNSLGLVTNTLTVVGNFSYTYDNANRLSALLNPFNEEFQFDFDLANRLTKISRPGSTTQHVFDATNFLTEIRHENLSGEVIGKFEYARDAIGNRTGMRSPAGENQFSYDPDQQITGSIGPDVGIESFQYDEIGNRTQDAGGAYVYDQKRQRLVEDYHHFYYYDNNGNLSSKITKDLRKTEDYHYSSENQLIKIEWFENNVLLKEARYSFDVLGRRMQKVVIDHQNSTEKTRRFAYLGQEVIGQFDTDNKVLAVYTPSGLRTDDTLSVKVTGEGVAAGAATEEVNFAYLKDGLGSITHLANSSGVVKERYLYSAFGTIREILDESGAVTTSALLEPYHSYTNRELDRESGLYFYRARHYDSITGRFIQSDPDAGFLNNPKSFNSKYSYAISSPLNFTDPSGESVFDKFKALVTGQFLAGPLGQWAAVNFSGEFNSTEIMLVNIAVIVGAGVGGPAYISNIVTSSGISAGAETLVRQIGGSNHGKNILESFYGGFVKNVATGLFTYGLTGINSSVTNRLIFDAGFELFDQYIRNVFHEPSPKGFLASLGNSFSNTSGRKKAGILFFAVPVYLGARDVIQN